MRFQAGDYLVDVVVDIDQFELPITEFLPGITADTIEFARTLLEPNHIDVTRNRLLLAIQSFVLHAGERTILLDSCVGEEKERRLIPEFHRRARTGFLDGLARIDVPAESVDFVFCTHLHVDHVGWNTRLHDGRWVPTFPNARYLTGRREFEYWQQRDRDPIGDGVQLPGFEDSVLPIAEAGLLDLVDDGYELAEGLTLLPLAGHTPGQLGVRADGSAPAVFCGDAIHTPVQVLDPELSTNGCVDVLEAARVRRVLLENAVDDDLLIVPAHFRGGGCMRVGRTGRGFVPHFAQTHCAPS
jgi:glyoxylase-like metal-dependent hydrolase (beta-lactamase superfamily II)